MKELRAITELGKKLFGKLAQYKLVLVVVLVGIIFLSWPDSSKNDSDITSAVIKEENFSVEALENKLASTLSLVDGAGNVQVMLTVQSGIRRVYAQDGSTEQENGSLDRKVETVIVSTGSGREETVLVQQIYPQFHGALIVADGGADPTVRLKLTQAVAALTGIGTDKISICKRK